MRNKIRNKEREQIWRDKNPERNTRNVRRATLRRIGWTLERYDDVLEEQGGVCGICGKEVVGKYMDADHKHTVPPTPRGLLCNSCNQLLGYAHDNTATLKAAVSYLLKHEMNAPVILEKEKKTAWNKGTSKGICWNTAKKAWQVYASVNGKTVNLGRYKDRKCAEIRLEDYRRTNAR